MPCFGWRWCRPNWRAKRGARPTIARKARSASSSCGAGLPGIPRTGSYFACRDRGPAVCIVPARQRRRSFCAGHRAAAAPRFSRAVLRTSRCSRRLRAGAAARRMAAGPTGEVLTTRYRGLSLGADATFSLEPARLFPAGRRDARRRAAPRPGYTALLRPVRDGLGGAGSSRPLRGTPWRGLAARRLLRRVALSAVW